LQSEQAKLRDNDNNAASALKILEDVVQEFKNDVEVMQSLKNKLDALFSLSDSQCKLPLSKTVYTLELNGKLHPKHFINYDEAKWYFYHAIASQDFESVKLFKDEELLESGDTTQPNIELSKPTETSSGNSELLQPHPMIFFDAHADSMRLFLFTKDHAVATYEKAKEGGLAKQHQLHKRGRHLAFGSLPS
jgi:hypothetical protein